MTYKEACKGCDPEETARRYAVCVRFNLLWDKLNACDDEKKRKKLKKDLTKAKDEKELPFEFMNYVRFIEKEVGVPISIISLGPDRDQTIVRE